MDFKLTDEQELIVDSYRDYMESENWEAYFAECDEKHEYPLRWVRGLCELGFDLIMLPESHGGLGLEQPAVTMMAVYEVLGRYGAPTYVLYQLPGFETIIREGTEEQIEAVLSTLGTGEQIWNSACTEPGAGSDVAALQTTYKRENGKIYLNGTKTFITSSAGVKYLVIMAKNADDPEMFTEFFLDMSKPGVSLSPLHKLGLRMDSCCEVYMDNVELEEKDIFGKEGNGFSRGINDFNFERWLVGASDYGMSIAIKLKNMKNMLYETAWEADNNDGKFDPGAAAMCKYYCANSAFSVVDDGMQILAGVAVAGEHRAQRIWRDLRVDRVSGGTDEMMILTASKFELKKYRD